MIDKNFTGSISSDLNVLLLLLFFYIFTNVAYMPEKDGKRETDSERERERCILLLYTNIGTYDNQEFHCSVGR